jgi:hypothetical protein
MPRIYVFYAGKLHSEHLTFPKLEDLGEEIYNGAYIWIAEQWMPYNIFEPVGWYRADRTPRPDDEISKELRTLTLLLR